MGSTTSLRAKRDFETVYSGGRRRRANGVTVYVRAREDAASPARLGLAVPSSIGGAVERNRMKRRLRAAFRACEATGVDVIVRPSGGATRLSFQELVTEFCRAVRRTVG